MKSIMPWFCLVATVQIGAAYADDGVDAYRVGHYKDAVNRLARTPTEDPLINYYMGRMRLYGYGGLKNNEQAIRYFKRSAEKGFLPAQNIMARYELLQNNNPTQALYWFKKAADANDIQAQMYCASAYLFGLGVNKNEDVARKYYIAAARNGNSIAQYTLADNFLNSKQSANKSLGLLWLNKSVAQGNPDAQLLLARLYGGGKYIEHDLDKAQALTRALADKGYGPALYQMGEYARVLGNIPAAKDWYDKAIKQHYSPAETALAKLYVQEKSPIYDPHTGFLVTLTAAQEGSAAAQLALSTMYKAGIGVEADENLAKEWQQKASETEHNPKLLSAKAARWLSAGKFSTFAESGYAMPGILSAWQNAEALKENNYNQPPQMEELTREALFKPKFVMTKPNQIAISEFYDVLVRLSTDNKQAQPSFPRYPFEVMQQQQQIAPSLEKAEGFDYLQHAKVADDAHAQAEFKKLEGQAILGDSTAQFDVAQMYQHGVGVVKNIEQAIKFYTLATRQEDLRAEYNLGLIYLEGEGVAADYKRALLILRDAAFKGNPYAQYVVATIDEQGYWDSAGNMVVQIDKDQAIAMYDLAAANNFGLAQYRLAQILVREPSDNVSVDAINNRNLLLKSLYQGAVRDNVKAAALPLAFYHAMDPNKTKQAQAFAVAIKEANEGNKEAALLLGLLYDRGIGVGVSQSDAIHWYQQAGNNPVSAFILGSYFSQGIGVNEDKVQGKSLLEKSANAGFAYAYLNLAVLKRDNKEAFVPELDKALELGNSSAGLLLADYYMSLANNNKQQMGQAREIYQRFADKSDKDAQLKLGFMLERGLGGQVDFLMAQKWYLASAAQGQYVAQYLLGHLNQLGRLESQPNYIEAKKWYASAALHYAPAAVGLGFIYDTVDDNYQQAFANFSLAASQHDSVGEYDLALMYDKGKGRPVDFTKAKVAYLDAANQGYIPAMVSVAQLYFNGDSGSRDEQQALHWYKKAAELGDRDALYQLGLLSETGVASKLDYQEAVHFYQQAAKLGDAKAIFALARMYQFGFGVPKDLQQAETLYKELATQSNGYAQYQLALLYANSSEPVSSQSRLLLQQAQDNGSLQARKTLQWLNAQAADRVSFIEPIAFTPTHTEAASQSAELMYLDALNAWNHGDEASFRTILSHIVGQYPDYLPAKRAYEHVTPGAWG